MKAKAGLKKCPHCTKLGLGSQPVARFAKHAMRPDGLQDECRDAAAEAYQKRTYGQAYVQPKQRTSSNKGSLQGILDRLSGRKYDKLNRMMLQLAQKKYDTPKKSAKWLGMKLETFEILLLKFRVKG